MKISILYIHLLLLIVSDSLYAQNAQQAQVPAPTTCLQNGQFANACASSPYACSTFDDDCGDGWVRSHGTPNIATYTKEIVNGVPVTGHYVFMWTTVENNVVIGEGIFTPYLFKQNHTYEVKLKVGSNSTNGKINVYAANGLVKYTLGEGCGTQIPNVTKSLIGVYWGGGTGGEVVLSYVFTNTSGVDLTQLWIYPEGVNGYQYELNLKWVDVCPSCTGTVNYNSGVAPSGTTSAAIINAGSTAGTGGSGTVTIDGTANTVLSAYNEINLVTESDITVSNGSFVAQIVSCPNGSTSRIVTDKGRMPLVAPVNDLQNKTAPISDKKLNVYPTVSTGLFNITGDSKMFENVELTVFDLLGKRVLQIPKRSYSGLASINLSNLNNGTYLLQIKQKDNSTTKKIIIRK